MEPFLISIILPTYNRSDMLADALRCLIRQETCGDFDYEIVVVDNASTDNTRAVVEQIADESPVPLRYIHHEEPGCADARNCGIEAAHGHWLAFFDDDQMIGPEWLRQLYLAAVETGAPIVGGAVHLDLPVETLRRLGREVRKTLLREIDYHSTIHPYVGKQLPGTGNALIARHVFQKVGGFDATLVNGGSDRDFFLRAQAAGVPLYYTPHAIIRHRIPPNRLSMDYLHWDAQQGCDTLALGDFRKHGRLGLLIRCAARLGQGVLIIAPRMVWGWLKRDPGEVLSQRVRLWRLQAYLRRTGAILAPRWLSQRSYFARLDFRRGRVVGQKANAEAAS
jgi:glucosyl-dolichyl phosphate glucuronosyltransferase